MFRLAELVILASVVSGALGQDCYSGICDHMHDPVCGTDGVTYLNYCYLKRAACSHPSLDVDHLGACTRPLVNTACGSITCTGIDTTTLICGTDGNTYHGKCEFLMAQCRYVYTASGSHLEVAHMGACRNTDVRPASIIVRANYESICDEIKNCDHVPTKMCGQDGSTWATDCDFQRARCHYALGGFVLMSVPCPSDVTTTEPTTTVTAIS